MSNPDFSKSPEHVALAKVMCNAAGCEPQDWALWLPEADAAITHLGSGYRLPEATEANLRRYHQKRYPAIDVEDLTARDLEMEAEDFRAMQTAFADAEPSTPAEAKARWEQRNEADWLPRCTEAHDGARCKLVAGHEDAHDNGELSWQSGATEEPEKPRDITAERERRAERAELVLQFLTRMVGTAPIRRESDWDAYAAALRFCEGCADAYLAWRDAEEAKVMEAYRCKK